VITRLGELGKITSKLPLPSLGAFLPNAWLPCVCTAAKRSVNGCSDTLPPHAQWEKAYQRGSESA